MIYSHPVMRSRGVAVPSAWISAAQCAPASSLLAVHGVQHRDERNLRILGGILAGNALVDAMGAERPVGLLGADERGLLAVLLRRLRLLLHVAGILDRLHQRSVLHAHEPT